MMKETYINRRKQLFTSLEEGAVAILHSGFAQFKTADANYDFVVNHNFYYLTGIDQADVTLVVGNIQGKYYEWLFLEPIDYQMAKWVGKTLEKTEASAINGIAEENIRYNNSFMNFMASLLQPTRHFSLSASIVYLDLEYRSHALYETFGLKYAKTLKEQFPSTVIKNIYATIIGMRMIKSEEEIAEIINSIGTTKRAIYSVMGHANQLTNECVAQAHHDFVLISENKRISFSSIIAGGKNGTVLHYVANNQALQEDNLLLMDVGCYTKHYSSDISRTFPLSGKFTKRQKEVYEVVLDVNKKCIAYAKAGISWKDINDYAKSLLAAGCKKLGLIQEDHELSKYYFHSIGHSLGLDVHDPSMDEKGLLEGMVITIEPGLYIEEENIGIRIEDNIVITQNEAILLSKDIIKEIDDIEKWMNQ